jgi:hypothetical protein
MTLCDSNWCRRKIVALANKLARMARAVLTKNEAHRPPLLAGNTI